MSPLGSLQFLKGKSSKATFKNACERYDLVYFGSVSQHTDEHQMVRGFTLSPSHVDRHYCVGTVSGRDIILLERTDTISFASKPSKGFTWVILQIDLSHKLDTHIILNSCRYEEVVYDNLFAKVHNLKLYSKDFFTSYDQKFLDNFAVYAQSQHSPDVLSIIEPGMASVLGHHFSGMDYEFFHDNLIIYLPTKLPTDSQVESLIKAGLWLSDQIDNKEN